MPRYGIRTLLIVIAVCAVGLAIYPWPETNKATAFEDLAKHPSVVSETIDKLAAICGGCTLDDFEMELSKIGSVKVPLQHFKDFEFYWSIDTGSEDFPHFIIAGNFASGNGNCLAHATVNIVEEPRGAWRTIWLVDYATANHDFLPPRIRR
jgi:hypothetical protein